MKPIVIKTSNEKINEVGTLVDAANGPWYISPNRAKNYTHLIVTLRGEKDVKAVYKIDKIEHACYSRYYLKCSEDSIQNNLIGKELNHELFKKGRQNPVAYMTEQSLLEV